MISLTSSLRQQIQKNPKLITPKLTRYIPYKPYPKQAAFLLLTSRFTECLFGGGAGGAKALQISTPIFTPDGWTEMGLLEVGDKVYSPEGSAVQITYKSPVMEHHCWKLTFDDGSEVVADDDHLWLTFNEDQRKQLLRLSPEYREKRKATRPSRAITNKPVPGNSTRIYNYLPAPTGSVITTSEIVRTLYSKRKAANHAIPLCKPLKGSYQYLSIDPYCLGVWLGDGASLSASISVHDDDAEELMSHFISCGWNSFKEGHQLWRICETEMGLNALGRRGRVSPWMQEIQSLGLRNNKHVPEQYLLAEQRYRLALLQGLMDTDGTVDKHDGCCSFCNTNKNLAESVHFLALSFGWKATITEFRTKLNGNDCGPGWIVRFMADKKVFRLKRKADLQKPPTRKTTKYRYIIKAEEVESAKVCCIRVEGGYFLEGKTLIPTHNTWALLMAALQYVDHPDYHCIIFRRTYTDLSLPNGLLDISREWLSNTDATWHDKEKTWRFPSGATITFGYLETEKDKYRYQGSEYTTIIFDELGQFEESQYLYLFSRLRKALECPLPLRMISASNPGSEWVKERFITNRQERIFLPALYTDNPYLDHDSYSDNLDKLDYLTRQQLKYGDWDVVQNGELFKYEWIHYKDEEKIERLVRYWDLASSENKGDYTAGVLLSFSKGSFQVLDVKNVQYSSLQVEELIKKTYEEDRTLGAVNVYMEQEPGSSGKSLVEHYQRSVLPCIHGIRSTGSKVERARPLSALFESGRISLVKANWNNKFIEQLLQFPNGANDDIVDSLSGCYSQLSSAKTYDLLFA